MIRLPDLDAIPEIGSPQRNADEEAALARGSELIHECGGRLRDALARLELELRGTDAIRLSAREYGVALLYARKLVNHVEQCWATAVVR